MFINPYKYRKVEVEDEREKIETFLDEKEKNLETLGIPADKSKEFTSNSFDLINLPIHNSAETVPYTVTHRQCARIS